MAIKLGKNPKDFKKDISVTTIDGVTETLSLTYIYRTPAQLAELFDARIAAETAAAEAALAEAVAAEAEQGETTAAEAVPADKPSIAESYIAKNREQAANVLEIATGWDLEDAFTVDNLVTLEGQFPGALAAIQARYQQAVVEVRVKN